MTGANDKPGPATARSGPPAPPPAKKARVPRKKRIALVRVPFHGEELEATREGDRVLVPIRRIAEAFGLAPRAQLARLRRAAWVSGIVMIPQVRHGDDQAREVACIDVDALGMWLATLDVDRVRPELREKLAVYQREAAAVLREHFFGAPARADPPTLFPRFSLDAPLPSDARMDTVERVLSFTEEALFVYRRILVTPCMPRATALPFYEEVQAGIAWTSCALGALAHVDPKLRARVEAAEERHRSLRTTFYGLGRPARAA